MAERVERFAGYAQARLRVRWHGGGTTELRPADEGTGDFPFDGPVHVLTAHNPGPERLDAAENQRRQEALVAELPAEVETWCGDAGAVDGSHVEESVVVRRLSDETAVALAARYGQDAIFRWTAEAWSILPCDGGEPLHRGWRTRSVGSGRGDRPD
ncbi:DUF3293 domain-containing protein [Actinomycetospora termitidis]|uniref:DUF3293 domain-containing protein n=1 Tax=Actinomycetospora termitidis TaxID=3053470 RepID=A0ABT7MFD4_9PSEU|nr:DUF3293 domain-containing protein [Actinomycetospora sp. Odt1-22]MDL5158682.1 DUF3293 domain-containing protein [Actinomycetospora sp. Odt1-22]